MHKKLVLVEHDPEWKNIYKQEAQKIKNILGNELIEIHHIGSTAIPDLIAKPIIDILVVVKNIEALDSLQDKFVSNDYEWMGEYGISDRRFILKPNPNKNNRQLLENLAHIHCFQQGSPHIIRHIAFRDYLLKNPDIVKKYANLKRKLLKSGVDRDQYQNQKDAFIKAIEQEAIRQKN